MNTFMQMQTSSPQTTRIPNRTRWRLQMDHPSLEKQESYCQADPPKHYR